MIKKLLIKHKILLLYVFFGVLTTIINTVIFTLLYEICHWANILSNIVAWIAAVFFAYVTNKIWVFEASCKDIKVVQVEFSKFIGCRIITGVLDLLIMFIGIDLMKGSSVLFKIISNIIVIICNYIASKLLIFKCFCSKDLTLDSSETMSRSR